MNFCSATKPLTCADAGPRAARSIVATPRARAHRLVRTVPAITQPRHRYFGAFGSDVRKVPCPKDIHSDVVQQTRCVTHIRAYPELIIGTW